MAMSSSRLAKTDPSVNRPKIGRTKPNWFCALASGPLAGHKIPLNLFSSLALKISVEKSFKPKLKASVNKLVSVEVQSRGGGAKW